MAHAYPSDFWLSDEQIKKSQMSATPSSNKVATSKSKVSQEPSTRTSQSKVVEDVVQRKNIEMLQATLEVMPDPKYRARNFINIEGVGNNFKGTYYVKQCTHRISKSGYSCNMSLIKTVDNGTAYNEDNRRDPAPLKPSGITYRIVWGDTLWRLAIRFNTTVKAIASLNGIKDPDVIYAGDTIKIPA